jgi:hypothetical protein
VGGNYDRAFGPGRKKSHFENIHVPRLLYSDLSKQSRIDKFSELVIGSNPFSESLLTRIAGSLGNQSTNRGALYLYLQMAWTDRSAIL